MDAISALMGLEVSDEEKTRALADRLRSRKDAADYFAMSTIKPLSQLGIQEQSDLQAAAKTFGGLRRSLAERQQQSEQRDEDRVSRELIAEENRLSRAETSRENAELRQTIGGGSSNRIYNPQKMLDEQGNQRQVGYTQDGRLIDLSTRTELTPEQINSWTEFRPMNEAQQSRALGKFSENVKTNVPLIKAVDDLDTRLDVYAKKGTKFDQVPGLGMVDKNQGLIGQVSRFVEDQGSEKSEYSTNYAAVKRIMNLVGVSRAGLAQTKSEIERIYKEFGVDPLASPQVFMEYYPRLKSAIEADMMNVRSGTKPQILEEYDSAYPEGTLNPSTYKFRRLDWGDKKPQYPPGWTEEDIKRYEATNNG